MHAQLLSASDDPFFFAVKLSIYQHFDFAELLVLAFSAESCSLYCVIHVSTSAKQLSSSASARLRRGYAVVHGNDISFILDETNMLFNLSIVLPIHWVHWKELICMLLDVWDDVFIRN